MTKNLEDKLSRLTPAQRALYEKRLAERKAKARRRATSTEKERIPPRPSGMEAAPLSFSQQRLWFLERMEPGNPAYHISTAVRLEGKLQERAFGQAVEAMVERHESLRTTFSVVQGEPVQRVHPASRDLRDLDVQVARVDLASVPGQETEDLVEERLQALALEEARRPFDLEAGPLLRLTLARWAPDRRVLLLTFHHIISDGWSLALFVRELLAFYRSFEAGVAAPLGEPRLQYPDYAVWQREHLVGEELERQLTFWRRQLEGADEALNLPTDRPRPPVQTFVGDKVSVRLEESATVRLRALAKAESSTLFVLLLAAWQTLLHRISGQPCISVGTPIANRTRSETEQVLGFFVNTLVMRTDLTGDPSFRDLVRRARKTALEAYAHQDLPFERLVQELQPRRDLSRPPLFQVQLAFRNTPKVETRWPGLEVSLVAPDRYTAQFDLTLSVSEVEEGLVLSLEHNVDLFDSTTARRLVGHLRELLREAARRPETSLSRLPLMTPVERHRVLRELNDTGTDLGPPATLDELVRAVAERTPDSIAVAADGAFLTYGGLIRRAEAQARRLRAAGAGPETLVGVVTERSLELPPALLAVMLVGAAYVPLDPGYPADRLRLMLEDSGVSVVLTPSPWSEELPLGSIPRLLLDRPAREPPGAPGEPSEKLVDGLAYTIYTSGSTGRPKGAMNSHRAIVNRLRWMQSAYGLGPSDAVLQKTPASFDVSVWEFFWPLMAGARLVMAKPEGHKDPVYLADLVVEEGITTLHFVPSMLRPFLEQREVGRCRSLRRVIASGEALPRSMVRRFYERLGDVPRLGLHNLYGPTEAAVDVTAWPCSAEADREQVPIGRPISNLRIHVVDHRFGAVPVGVPGELLISGEGLARGYRKRPDLTADRFRPDPFAGDPGAPGGRAYRTGDLVRTAAGGEIEFLGRLDHQVKIRGFRIELGEIEAALLSHPDVRETVVVDRPTPRGDRILVAYVSVTGRSPTAESLRRALGRGLPEHMIPSMFVFLDALPLLPNGKVDRKSLPAPEAAGEETRSAPPRGRLQRRLADLWSRVLGIDRVGAEDNFFDLGGHSLLLVEVQRLLSQELGYDVDVMDLFQQPTVASLARFLGAEPGEEEPERQPEERVVKTRRGRRDVAVLAVAGRFPGAQDVESFWSCLRQGRELIRRLSREEMLADGADPEWVDHPSWVPAWGVLGDVDRFDARFFGFSPREAQILDPQQRLFLETAWEALERAGLDPERFPGRIGVFAGTSISSYAMRNLTDQAELVREVGAYQAMIGNDKDYIATRTAYGLGLRGPAVGVQTACSTSLVATVLALEALAAGHCDAALVGGVSIKAQQKAGYQYQQGHILSPDGHCRAFDAEAAGTVGGSGVGIVVLRPLEAALEAGDPVLAVLKGGAFNNDGAQKVGFTAPSIQGQEEVLTAAYEESGVDPATVGYVEAHGTGTPLGDPIEVTALRRAFARSSQTLENGSCALGSVKTNVGHLDAAAGVTGLIKAVLTLDREEIPPSLHFETPNPKLDLENSPFRIAAERIAWPRGERPRRAGVSSFGIGGTNAHVVLEEAPSRELSGPSRELQLYVLSARDDAALDCASGRLGRFLEANDGIEPGDVAFTLAVGRKAFERRRAVVAATPAEAASVLTGAASASPLDGTVETANRSVAFLFPGQGAQYPGMGEELYAREAAFRREIDRCCEILRPEMDLRAVLFPSADDGQAATRLAETRHAQPALFAVEYALARLWMSWGIRPWALLGHSVGEFVAASLAGVFSLEDGLKLVAARGRLLQELPTGSMLSVPLPEERVAPRLGEDVTVAAVNAPGWTVVSGPTRAVETLAEAFDREGIETKSLRTSHAFHSAMMEPAREPFERLVARLSLGEPRIPFVSNVSGGWIRSEEATDPSYWARHLVEPVRFGAGMETLLQDPDGVFLEVGPGRGLTTLGRQQRGSREGAWDFVTTLGPARDRGQSLRRSLEALGRLWVLGIDVDWSGYFEGERRRKALLPTYPFARERHWVEHLPAGKQGRDTSRRPGAWLESFQRRAAGARPAAENPTLEVVGSWEAARRLTAALWQTGARVAWTPSDEDAPARLAPGVRIVLAREGIHPAEELERRLDGLPDGATLVVVTRGGRSLLAEPVVPAMAAWGAAARALAQRRGGLPVRWLDLDPAELSETDGERFADEVLRAAGSDSETLRDGAVRGGRFWELDYESVPGGSGSPGSPPDAWRILHVGGGFGRELARRLEEAGVSPAESAGESAPVGIHLLGSVTEDDEIPDTGLPPGSDDVRTVFVAPFENFLTGPAEAVAATERMHRCLEAVDGRGIFVHTDPWTGPGPGSLEPSRAFHLLTSALAGLRFGEHRELWLTAGDPESRKTQGPVGGAREERGPEEDVEETAPEARVSAVEAKVAHIWSRLLGVERPGLQEDFFELGGHSLLATRVMSRVRDAFAVDLPLETLFEAPTVRGLAARIEVALEESAEGREAAGPVLPDLVQVSRDRDLPLSFGQQRLWFLHQLRPESPFYNIPLAVRLEGRLEVAALDHALGEILRRHETLRTRFALVEGDPVQRIEGPSGFHLPVIDLRGLSPSQRQNVLGRLADAEAQRPFDLHEAPVLRGLLARVAEDRWTVLLTIHHIASDAWSFGVLMDELSSLYPAFRDGRPSVLAEPPIQYADYAVWQREVLTGEVFDAQLAYWKEQFAELPPPLELPTDRPRPSVQTFSGAACSFALGRALTERLGRLGRNRGATVFMTLLAALQVLLGRLSGQLDVTVGVPIAGRRRVELEGLIGFFVNTLALRTHLSGAPSFEELLERVRTTTLGAQAHQDLPFETLVEELQPPRDLSRTPLFQVLFALQNVPPGQVELEELILSPMDSDSAPARFDLTLFAYEGEQGIWGRWVYNRALFDHTSIERLARRLETLLAAAVEAPECPVTRLPVATGPERHQLLVEQPSRPEKAGSRPIHERFLAWAERAPETPAVVFEDVTLDYRTLAARSCRLARRLRREGIGPESRVGLWLPRSADMIVALLGVLQAGGTYVPLELGLPEERLAFMMEDAGLELLLTGGEGEAPATPSPVRRLELPAGGDGFFDEPEEPLEARVHPAQLVYVLYTSGSTGRPKGVGVEHRNLAAYVDGILERLELSPGASFASVSTLAADLGNTSVFGALASGGVLHVLSGDRVSDPEAMADYGEAHPIDVLKIVPSHLAALQASLRPERVLPVRRLLLGGEALHWEEIQRLTLLSPTCRVLNHYGPTEATVGVLTHTAWTPEDRSPRTRRGAGVPLGRPLDPARVHLLDREGELAPLGAVGEISLGGASVTRGYVGRPAATAERFVPDPFARIHGEAGARLYRTGDLGRRLPGGEIEFLGRRDHQVKIRGFRIELGEIEAVLETHPSVREVVAGTREYGPGDRRLVAWVVWEPDEPEVPVEDLQEHLRHRLPDYMSPSAFVFLEALPLTPNGKVDRRALPDPEAARPQLASEYLAPTDEMERTLAAIWCDALQVDRVGRSDNFFDLGGHSLLLVRVHAEMRRQLERDLPLTALFQNPTVAELANFLKRRPDEGHDLAAETEALTSRFEAGKSRRRRTAERRRRAAEALKEV